MVVVPNFLYVGVDKAGSTWLHKVLRQHPQVFVAEAKDLYYFDRHYERGLAWYSAFFAAAPAGATAIGEICHDYLRDPEVPARIQATLGRPRILITLREPLSRARSAYQHARKVGGTTLPFAEALERHAWLLRGSFYAADVERYVTAFGPDRVTVLLFDDLVADPGAYLAQVCAAIDVTALDAAALDLSPAQTARDARFPSANRMAKRGAELLRARGHVGLVGRLKHASIVQNVLYRSAPPRADLDDALTDQLRTMFAGDVTRTGAVIGVDLATRWGYGPAPAR